MTRTLVWFRDDLRTADHPALRAAVEHATAADQHAGVVGLYVLDDHTPGIRPLGGAARWWLHHALESLKEELADLGIPLLIRAGDPYEVVTQVAAEVSADRVHWSRRCGHAERQLDAAVKKQLPQQQVEAESFPGTLLHEPWTLQTTTGGPYKVFTPFWNALSADPPREPEPAPPSIGAISSATSSLTGAGVPLGDVADLDLLPTAPDWAGGLRRTWDATEKGGHAQLHRFVGELAEQYDDARDQPALNGTSRLSPYLRWGQLSPFQVWEEASAITHATSRSRFRSELGWREFCAHLLYHFPQLPEQNLRSQFDAYPWRTAKQEPEAFTAWTAGKTGLPWVDAGMRELWETGHMHNRVRMAAASLLVKNLGVHWREGEAWFWDTLVDADPASNPANWQWVAGSGMDAAPYFRIFNPERQRSRFDPDDEYIRQWIPELDTDAYPEPIVDLKASRQEALDQYSEISSR